MIERVERTVAERISVEEGLRALGIAPRRVAGQLLLVRSSARRPARRGEVVRGLASAACSSARAARWAASRGPARVTYGTPAENARFLAALRELVAGPLRPVTSAL